MTMLHRRTGQPGQPLAVTSGDPAGIGFDVTLEAWTRRHDLGLPPFYVLAAPDMLRQRASELGLNVPVVSLQPSEATARFDTALPVVAVEFGGRATAGQPDTANAAGIIGSIEQAVGHVRTDVARALITNPIAKHVLYEAGFAHPGHTEFLGDLALAWGPPSSDTPYIPIMMLAGPQLRTVPVTVHVALAEAVHMLTTDLIMTTGRIVADDLQRRFQIARPRLAIAGLNPHAGEQGSMGREDMEIVAPAVEALRALGIDAFGPLPADTLFHAGARALYDVALCMYHDQALIPVKTLAFDETVNVTLGLPFVRTSPDHGTAFDIAGTGKARPQSFIAALRLADQLTRTAAAVDAGLTA